MKKKEDQSPLSKKKAGGGATGEEGEQSPVKKIKISQSTGAVAVENGTPKRLSITVKANGGVITPGAKANGGRVTPKSSAKKRGREVLTETVVHGEEDEQDEEDEDVDVEETNESDGGEGLNGVDIAQAKKVFASIISLLQKKDPHGYFMNPVTEDIAPDYFKYIKEPMDFKTMTKKNKEGRYTSIEELVYDFNLICNNCMRYNDSSSVYYKEAKKLSTIGKTIISTQKSKLNDVKPMVGPITAQVSQATLRERERKQQAQNQTISSTPVATTPAKKEGRSAATTPASTKKSKARVEEDDDEYEEEEDEEEEDDEEEEESDEDYIDKRNTTASRKQKMQIQQREQYYQQTQAQEKQQQMMAQQNEVVRINNHNQFILQQKQLQIQHQQLVNKPASLPIQPGMLPPQYQAQPYPIPQIPQQYPAVPQQILASGTIGQPGVIPGVPQPPQYVPRISAEVQSALPKRRYVKFGTDTHKSPSTPDTLKNATEIVKSMIEETNILVSPGITNSKPSLYSLYIPNHKNKNSTSAENPTFGPYEIIGPNTKPNYLKIQSKKSESVLIQPHQETDFTQPMSLDDNSVITSTQEQQQQHNIPNERFTLNEEVIEKYNLNTPIPFNSLPNYLSVQHQNSNDNDNSNNNSSSSSNNQRPSIDLNQIPKVSIEYLNKQMNHLINHGKIEIDQQLKSSIQHRQRKLVGDLVKSDEIDLDLRNIDVNQLKSITEQIQSQGGKNIDFLNDLINETQLLQNTTSLNSPNIPLITSPSLNSSNSVASISSPPTQQPLPTSMDLENSSGEATNEVQAVLNKQLKENMDMLYKLQFLQYSRNSGVSIIEHQVASMLYHNIAKIGTELPPSSFIKSKESIRQAILKSGLSYHSGRKPRSNFKGGSAPTLTSPLSAATSPNGNSEPMVVENNITSPTTTTTTTTTSN